MHTHRVRLGLVIASFLLLVSVFLATHVLKFPGSVSYLMEITEGRKTLDTQASFSSEETYRRLDAFGDRGREMYKRMIFTVDIVFPLCVFVFFFVWSRYAADRTGARGAIRRSLLIIPIAYLALDFLENASILMMLWSFPDRLQFPATYVGYLTVAKRVAMISGLLLPAGLLIVARVSAFRRRALV